MIIHQPGPTEPASLCGQPGLVSHSLIYTPTCPACHNISQYVRRQIHKTPAWNVYFREKMIEAGYAIPAVTQIASDLEVCNATVYAWLKGTNKPNRDMIERLAQTLGKSTEEIERVLDHGKS